MTRLARWLLAISFVLQASVVFAQDAALERARALLDAGQAKEAFALLEPLEAKRAGDPAFDFLLGVAAVDAGQPTRGIFALERVLAVQPDNARARAEIARAYFVIGELRTARQEFESVRRAAPPAVQAVVERFLDAISQRERRAGTGLTGFAEWTLGWDSNVNSATGLATVAVPGLGNLLFNLGAAARQQSDTFNQLAAGMTGRYVFNPQWSVFGGANGFQRWIGDNDRFDTAAAGVDGGVAWRPDRRNEFTLGGIFQTFLVGSARFRDAAGLIGQWRREVTPNDQMTLYVQRMQLDYPTAPARDAVRSLAGGAWAHSYNSPMNPVAFASVFFGGEKPDQPGSPQFGHRLYGARVGGQLSPVEDWALFANASYERRSYGGPDPLFLVHRKDREWVLRAGGNWNFARGWTFTPQVIWTENRSTISVNAYDRIQVQAALRYDFR